MTGDDLRALPAWVRAGASTPLRPGDYYVAVPAATRDALADLIDAAHLVLPDFDGGVAYKLDTDNLRGLGNALLALEADA